MQIIIETLTNKTPDEFDMPFLLWTRRAVQFLIENLWKIVVPIRTIGDYLKRIGFTPQKPLRRAYEQNSKAVQVWLEEEYPSIKEKAKRQKGQLHWTDETGIRSDNHYGRGYAPKGKTPVIRINVRRIKLSIISSITNKGKIRFMTYPKAMNAHKLIEFMRRLIRDTGYKIFMILDNLAVHHSKVVSNWLKNKTDRIEVFHLPSYSPELNPDEYLNRDLKKSFYSGSPARNIKQLKKHVFRFLKMLQRSPKRVKNYFKNKKIRFAA